MGKFGKIVPVRVTDEQFAEFKALLVLFPGRWRNISHYIRSAAIRQKKIIMEEKKNE